MLTYNEFKTWHQVCSKEFYDKLGAIFEEEPFKDKRANRIYLYPKMTTDYKLQSEIIDFLKEKNYNIHDEIQGMCIKIPKDAREKVSAVKIGKILGKFGQNDLLKAYTDLRTLHQVDVENYIIVVSRHPYDVVGVSTRRQWTSCIDLHEKTYKGEHLRGKFTDLLKVGSMAAYLIRNNDLNITDPVARMNFQYNKNNNCIYQYEMHGKPNATFSKVLLDWLNNVNKKLAAMPKKEKVVAE